jgi:uncharacterized protein YciI
MLKRIFFFNLLIFFSISVSAKGENESRLFIVHFQVGPSWDQSLKPQEQTKFQEHTSNLNRLRKEKVIVFGARYSDLGVIVVKANSLDAAKSIIAKDPGVQSGIFNFRIEQLNVFYPWEN